MPQGKFVFYFFFLNILSVPVACVILVLQPRMEPRPSALGAWSLIHWAARKSQQWKLSLKRMNGEMVSGKSSEDLRAVRKKKSVATNDMLVEVRTRSSCIAVSVHQGEAPNHELSGCKGCALQRCVWSHLLSASARTRRWY